MVMLILNDRNISISQQKEKESQISGHANLSPGSVDLTRTLSTTSASELNTSLWCSSREARERSSATLRMHRNECLRRLESAALLRANETWEITDKAAWDTRPSLCLTTQFVRPLHACFFFKSQQSQAPYRQQCIRSSSSGWDLRTANRALTMRVRCLISWLQSVT
jgi:hypothetical protein